MELRFEIVFAEERKHRMLSHHISSNSLCGSVVNKIATMNLIYECIIVVLIS